MKRLKRTLKEALSVSATIIRMRVNNLPEFETPSGLAKAKTVEPVEIDFLALMYREMFEGGEKFLEIGEPCKGRLMVSGYGDFLLMAVPKEKALLIVPPHEHQREAFEHLWNNVAGDTGAEVLTPVTDDNSAVHESARPAPIEVPYAHEPARSPGKAPMIQDEDEASPFASNIAVASIPLAKTPPPPPVPAPSHLKPLEGFPKADKGEHGPRKQNSIPLAFDHPIEVAPQVYEPQAGSFDLDVFAPPLTNKEPEPKSAPVSDEKRLPFSTPPAQAKVNPDSFLEENAFSWNDRPGDGGPISKAGRENPPVKQQPAVTSGIFTPVPPREAAAPAHHDMDLFQTPLRAPAPAAEVKVEPQIHYGPAVASCGKAGQKPNPIDELIEQMVKRGASDMHLTMGESVCLRVDAEIVRLKNWIATEQSMPGLIEPIIPAAAKQEFLRRGEADFIYELEQKGRFRVRMYRERNGVATAVHHIPLAIPSPEKLGLSPAALKWCEAGKGLILISGPTGCGKSTTMATMIDHINIAKTKHIITIEDPIEYVFEQKLSLIHQCQAQSHPHRVKKALAGALKEDPDVIMIADLSNPGALKLALTTAENGHLVIGALPMVGAITTIDRVIEQFGETERSQIRNLLAENLLGIVSQILLKKKGGGKVAAMEVLVNNATVKGCIKEAKTHMIKSLLQTKKSEGNRLLNESLVELVKQGLIDPSEADGKTTDKAELMQLLQQAGIPMRMMGSQVA